MDYQRKLHTFTCAICGAEYTVLGGGGCDWGMCHNCRERARQQTLLLNPTGDKLTKADPLDCDDVIDSLILYFQDEFDVDIDAIYDNCMDELSEIARNNYEPRI